MKRSEDRKVMKCLVELQRNVWNDETMRKWTFSCRFQITDVLPRWSCKWSWAGYSRFSSICPAPSEQLHWH